MRATFILLLGLVTACVTTEVTSLDPTQATTVDVRGGDLVRVLMRDARRVSFEVTAVEPDALVGTTQKVGKGDPTVEGELVSIAYGDIVFIERNRQWTTAQKTRAVVATVAVFTVVGAAVTSVAFVPAMAAPL